MYIGITTSLHQIHPLFFASLIVCTAGIDMWTYLGRHREMHRNLKELRTLLNRCQELSRYAPTAYVSAGIQTMQLELKSCSVTAYRVFVAEISARFFRPGSNLPLSLGAPSFLRTHTARTHVVSHSSSTGIRGSGAGRSDLRFLCGVIRIMWWAWVKFFWTTLESRGGLKVKSPLCIRKLKELGLVLGTGSPLSIPMCLKKDSVRPCKPYLSWMSLK